MAQDVSTPAAGDPSFKIIVIGDSGVGKSAVTIRFCDNTFFTEGAPTLGIDFKYARTSTLSDPPRSVKLQVWDTAGQETFLTLTTGFYRSCNGVLLCFDLTSRASFENLGKWLTRVEDHAGDRAAAAPGSAGGDAGSTSAAGRVPVILVGCKLDLAIPISEPLTLGANGRPGGWSASFRQVESSEAEGWAIDHKCVCYVETSAKDNTNIEHVFRHLATYLMETRSGAGGTAAADGSSGGAGRGKPGVRASRPISAADGLGADDAAGQKGGTNRSGCPC
jgi:Rab family protein